MKRFRNLLALLLALVLTLGLSPAHGKATTIEISAADYPVTQSGSYSSMEEVAVYIATYGKLPQNFLTKSQAEALGWDNREGNLHKVAPGCAIGGNRFGNYERVLPDKQGRKWTECDINYRSGYRNGERICFSNDGLIYYSNDHYNTFTRINVVKEAPKAKTATVKKSGKYISRDEVAAYLHQYGKLPANYLTRDEAKKLGWISKKDNLGKVAPGCAIGGDVFQNREKRLPDKKGRTWHECDVNRTDGKRSREKLVYSTDGLIYFTPDNHNTFTKLY